MVGIPGSYPARKRMARNGRDDPEDLSFLVVAAARCGPVMGDELPARTPRGPGGRTLREVEPRGQPGLRQSGSCIAVGSFTARASARRTWNTASPNTPRTVFDVASLLQSITCRLSRAVDGRGEDLARR